MPGVRRAFARRPIPLPGTPAPLAPLARRHLRTVPAVRRKHAMETVRLTRGFGTSAASRATKSSGSKMACVVPCPKHSLRSRGKLSRYGVLSWYRTLPFAVSDRRFSDTAGLAINLVIAAGRIGRRKRWSRFSDSASLVDSPITLNAAPLTQCQPNGGLAVGDRELRLQRIEVTLYGAFGDLVALRGRTRALHSAADFPGALDGRYLTTPIGGRWRCGQSQRA